MANAFDLSRDKIISILPTFGNSKTTVLVIAKGVSAGAIVWTVLSLLEGTPKPHLGHYSQRGGFYGIKRAVAFAYLQYLRSKQHLLPTYERHSNVTSKYGLVATKDEEYLEKPRSLPSDKNGLDAVQIFGMDDLGNTLIARLARRKDRSADVWLYLRLSSGVEYQLPHQPEVRVYNTAIDSFSAAGLTFEVLEPLRRWKISFNGLLRESIKNEFLNAEEQLDENIVHARFNFIWSPINSPFDSLHSVDNINLASAIATEKWSPSFLFKNLHLPKADWYDQWGQMQGSITIGDIESDNLFLRGRKERKFGTYHPKSIHRYAQIELYLEDGVTIHIKSLSYKTGLTHVSSGYVLHPRGVSERILDCDFNLDRLAENELLPPNFRLDIETESQKYLAVVTIEKSGFQAYLGDDWDLKVLVRRVVINGHHCNGYGVLELGYKNDSGCTLTPLSSIPFLEDAVFSADDFSNLLAVKLSDSRCCSSNLVGGKGMSLALMTSFVDGRFVVPKGLCVTVAAYWEHLKANPDIRKGCDRLQAVAGNTKDLTEQCAKLVDLISRTPIPMKIQTAIVQTLKSVFGDNFANVKLAVRSSAIGEDGEESSAAGQNDTVLGVRGPEHVWEALAKCWASQFSFVAVKYKRNNGKLLNEGMGVVIQEMVSADKAGVLFTRDPVTGSPGVMTVTANYGLGESVVSAAIDPDTIIIERTWRNTLTIGKKSIGKKAFQINLSDDGGTGETSVSGEMASCCCLTDEEILRLGQIGIVLENAFGGPRDIEWAIKDGQDYLLQSRAITTFERESDYLIEHELDGAILTNNEILTKANVGEVFPGATSPLTISTVMALFDSITLEKSFQVNPKRQFPLFTTQSMNSFHSHNFLNILQMAVAGTSKTLSKQTAGLGFSLLGRNFIDTSKCALIVRRHGPMTVRKTFIQMLPAIKESFWSTFASDCGKSKRIFNGNPIRIGYNDSAVEIYNSITEQFHHLRQAFRTHYNISLASQVFTGVMFQILTSKVDPTNVGSVHFTDTSTLLGTGSNVESAKVPDQIQKICASIGKHRDWNKFKDLTVENATKSLLEDKGEPGVLFQKFLENHGHRCIKEFDLRAKPWGKDYALIVKTIQDSFAKGVPLDKVNKPQTSVSESLNQITTPIKGWLRWFLWLITRSARKTMGKRETAKSIAILGVNVFREAYRKLADKMVAEGRIPDPDLIYFLTHNELDQFLQTRSPRLLRKAERRQRLHSKLDALIFPDLSSGMPLPIVRKPVHMASREVKFTLQASPAGPGSVTGRARVILNVINANQIKPGEILITYVTDIGWSPYFPILGGVVTELGGVISHGAVVSREYGIPCLISATRATELFQTGDLVKIDGRLGTLQLLEHAPLVEME